MGNRRSHARVKACLVKLDEAGHLTSELVRAADCDGRSGGPGRRYYWAKS